VTSPSNCLPSQVATSDCHNSRSIFPATPTLWHSVSAALLLASAILHLPQTLLMPTPSEPTALPWNYISKLVCIGDSGCGKSSLTIRLCEGRFVNSHDVTIGVEFGSRIVPVGPPANAALHINDPSSTSNPSNPSNGSPSGPTASASQRKGKGDREQKKMKVGRCSLQPIPIIIE
jgi:Ras family